MITINLSPMPVVAAPMTTFISDPLEPPVVLDQGTDEFGNSWNDRNAVLQHYRAPTIELPTGVRFKPKAGSPAVADILPGLMDSVKNAPDLGLPIAESPQDFPLASPSAEIADSETLKVRLKRFIETQADHIRENYCMAPLPSDGLDFVVFSRSQKSKKRIPDHKITDLVIERELAFCEHVIGRLTSIALATNASLTLLCDIDETLFTEDLGVRPAAVPLLTFLEEEFDQLILGIASTRGQKEIHQQLANEEKNWNIGELSPYIDSKAVYGVSRLRESGVNSLATDYSIEGGYSPNMAHILGWGAAQLSVVSDFVIPRLANLYLTTTIQSEIYFKYFYNRIYRKQPHHLAQKEIDTETPDTQAALNKFNQTYQKRNHRNEEIDADTGLNIYSLMAWAAETLGLASESHYIPHFWQPLLKAFQTRKEQLTQYNEAIMQVRIKLLLSAFNLPDDAKETNRYRIRILLQRIATGRYELQRGESQAVVVLDNDPYAELMDQLLQGRILSPDGKGTIDGYALLGLEDYRNKIFMISTGKRGAFSTNEIQSELINLP